MRFSQLLIKYRKYSLILFALLYNLLIERGVSFSFEIAEKQGVWKNAFGIGTPVYGVNR